MTRSGRYNNQLWHFVLNVTRPLNVGVTNQRSNAHHIFSDLAGRPQPGPISRPAVNGPMVLAEGNPLPCSLSRDCRRRWR